MEHTGFPSDETLAGFLDGRLDPDTRRRVIENMTTCNEGYAVVAGGAGSERESSEVASAFAATKHVKKARIVRSVLAAAIATVLLGGGWLVERANHHRSDSDALVATLIAVSPPTRNFEGRLSGFPYQPVTPVKRSENDH